MLGWPRALKSHVDNGPKLARRTNGLLAVVSDDGKRIGN